MGIYLKYFLFLGIPIGAMNALFVYYRVKSSDNLDSFNQSEAKKFSIGMFLSISIPTLLLGILQFLGGHDHCFFIFSHNFQDPSILLSWIVMFVSWGLLIYWVWIGKGAPTLIKYRKCLNLPKNTLLIKLYVTLMVLGGFSAILAGSIFEIDKHVEKSIKQYEQK